MHTFHSIENPSESTTEECTVNRGYIRATPSSGVLPYTTSDSISITISGNVPTTQWNFIYTSWYFNGGSLPSGTFRSYQLASARPWGFIIPQPSTMGHMRFYCNWILGAGATATFSSLHVLVTMGTLFNTAAELGYIDPFLIKYHLTCSTMVS